MIDALTLRENDLVRYTSEIRKYPLLSREQEHSLAVRFREHGDVEAAHALVVSNLRFVVKVANEFRGYGMKLIDLIQEGNIGLMMAVKKFDPSRGYRLISYGVWWIRAYMKNFLLRSWSSVKMGTTRAGRKLFFTLRSARRSLMDASGEAPTTQELAEALAVDVAEVEEMELRLAARDYSLDAEVANAGASRVESLPSHDRSQEEAYAERESRQLIERSMKSALAQLSERERYVVEQRFFADATKTLNEIGEEFGITRERVRQIEARAMEKLKRALPKDLAISIDA